MSRRPSRPIPRSRSSRRPARRGAGFRPTPFFWLVAGLAAGVALLAAGGGLWVLAHRPLPTPTALPPTATPSPSPTLYFTPTASLTPTPPLLPTEPPRLCETLRETNAYTLPALDAVREPLSAEENITVVGEIFEESIRWYRVILSGFERYIPAQDVLCAGEP